MTRVTTETRRRQIVDALAQLLEERSYAEASVANIASVAGLTPGLVHYHFATNRQILLLPRGGTQGFEATSRTSSARDYRLYLWSADR